MISFVISAFLMGLVGSFAHCAGMCYPFVLLISTKFSPVFPGLSLLFPHIKYNLGRITTYTFMGLIFGFAGDFIIFSHWWTFAKVLTILCGIVLILFAVKIPLHIPIINLNRLPVSNSPFIMGIILGFLPCGLVISGLINSIMSKNAWGGALSMFVFGIGTSCSLMLMAFFGGLIHCYAPAAKKIFTVLLFLGGLYLIYKGVIMH